MELETESSFIIHLKFLTMKLPSSGITWKHYRNSTPTFDLTPVEKPDFSPFLIHMTGKNSLVNILKGKNLSGGIVLPEKHGYLKATIPVNDGDISYYNAEVVCFTESPIFALDFFRYRSFRRWNEDQQFGIGFSKNILLRKHNVRPVVYLDTETNSQVLDFCNKILDKKLAIVDTDGTELNYSQLFEKLKPLLFPLLEKTEQQGFMWEREWRCPQKEGIVFPYSQIKVICCPQEEKSEIEGILGAEFLEQIEIIESWREYDEVTNYLGKRGIPNAQIRNLNQEKNLGTLTEMKNVNEQTINTLNSYFGMFKGVVDALEQSNLNEIIEKLKVKSKEIDEQILRVQDEKKNKKKKD